MFFVGKYSSKVDAKGRFVLPSQFKKLLGDTDISKGVIIQKSTYDKSIMIYTADKWEEMALKIKASLNEHNPEHYKYMVRLFSEVERVTIAENGRILLSKTMMQYGGIDNEVIITGQFDKIAVWSAKELEAQQMGDEQFADLTKSFLGTNNKEGDE